MNKETVSGYGWVIIVAIILSVVMLLASPFGKVISKNLTKAVAPIFEAGDFAE